MGTFFKWTFLIFFILLTIAIASINVASFSFRGNEYSLKAYFNSLNTDYHIASIPFEDKTIRYLETGLKSKDAPMILFIHGAPGCLDNFKAFHADYELKQVFKLISIDRLGYGESDYGHAETSIQKQADAIASVVDLFTPEKLFIVSHSYGGPISGKLSMDYPDKVDGLIMCAPLNDPKSEPMAWYSLMADWTISKWLMPAFINVATAEKMNHAVSINVISKDWKTIQCPVLHIHGEQDALAPCEENITFSKTNIDSQQLSVKRYADIGHFLIWENKALIKSLILDFISQIKCNP